MRLVGIPGVGFEADKSKGYDIYVNPALVAMITIKESRDDNFGDLWFNVQLHLAGCKKSVTVARFSSSKNAMDFRDDILKRISLALGIDVDRELIEKADEY